MKVVKKIVSAVSGLSCLGVGGFALYNAVLDGSLLQPSTLVWGLAPVIAGGLLLKQTVKGERK